MKAWLLLIALGAPAGAQSAGAPAPPMVVVPADTVTVNPTAVATVPVVTAPAEVIPVVRAPQLPDPTPVARIKAAETVSVARKDPAKAFRAALWPGFFLHGWGHHVAGDEDTFLNLAGGELFGVVMVGFGLNEALGPERKGETKETSQNIAIAGGVIYGITWIWDLAHASQAAKNYNRENKFALLPAPGGAQLAMTLRY